MEAGVVSEGSLEEPLLFCIETSGVYSGVAFLKGETLWEVKFSATRAYSTYLFQVLPDFLKHSPFSLAEVDYFVVDVGPGSFTGLRVGLSLLKALTLVYPKRVIPIESLTALAYGYAFPELPVITLVDAYTGEVYLGQYQRKGDLLRPLIPPTVAPLEKLPNLINGPTLLVSETLAKWRTFLFQKVGDKLKEPLRKVELSAGLIGRLAQLMLFQGIAKLLTGEEVLPLYLKPSQAERQRGLKIYE